MSDQEEKVNSRDSLSINKIPFTQVANCVLNNKKLSARAKGIYAYLYSKPEGWEFSYVRIAHDHMESKNTILKAIHELEVSGYLKRKKLKTGKSEYRLDFDPMIKDWSQAKKANDQSLVRPKIGHISNTDIKSNKETNIATTTAAAEVIPDLVKDKQKHIQIIGYFALAKKVKFENVEQQRSFIKRQLRAARDLCPYEIEKIKEVMRYLFKEADFKWTLETIGKYIDEDLTALKSKSGKLDGGEVKILRDGTKAVKKFGQWVLVNDNSIRVDLKYYPELAKN